MAESPRDVRTDLVGLGLSAATLYLLAALLSFNPADSLGDLVWPLSRLAPADQAVYPANPELRNACGWTGALTASCLLSSLGATAYLVALTPAIAAYRLFRYRRISAPVIRSLGWTLSLLAFATTLSQLNPPWQTSGILGAGGAIGLMAQLWLHDHFAAAGAYILTFTLLGFGLLLWTDYMLLEFSRRGGRVAVGAARKAGSTLKRPKLASDGAVIAETANSVVTDLPQRILGSEKEETPVVLPVKIRGRPIEPEAEEAGAPSAKTKKPSKAKAAKADEASTVTEEEEYDSWSEESEEYEDYEETTEASAEDASEDDSYEDEDDAETRELTDQEGQVKQLRKDTPHNEPRVKTPKERKEERQQVASAISEAPPEGAEEYVLPPVSLLTEADDVCYDEQLKEVRRKAKILEKTFADFGFNVRVVEIDTGPVIAQYEVELEAGLRLSKITGLADDLAIALRVPSVRIVAPIPGKNTVGIEVPNEVRQVVRIREVLEESMAGTKKLKIPIFLGKDVSGAPMVVDLAAMPHLLIAGRTGTGKSVCLNAIISSILLTRRPDEVRMLMIDPKMVELSGYGRLPHLMHPVVTDMRKAEAIMGWAVDKMEERYSLLARAGVRHISSYNQLGREELIKRLQPADIAEENAIPEQLPYIVIVADEMADLMMTAGKEVEQHIIRLAQKSRAVGIHLILATQKPTVDVITGLIKSNLPARIAFQVASRTDSRVVLDENGADKLLGNGDMLFLWPGTSTLIRGQGTYMSDEEIERVVAHCSKTEQNFVGELMNLKVEQEDAGEVAQPGALRKRDEMYESAIEVVIREGRGSVSLLQRALGIGYGRAARLIDYMAEDGIVGDYNGSQAREVVITMSQWEAMREGGGGEAVEDEAEAERPATGRAGPPRLRAGTEAREKSGGATATATAAARRRNVVTRGDDWEDDATGDEWEDA